MTVRAVLALITLALICLALAWPLAAQSSLGSAVGGAVSGAGQAAGAVVGGAAKATGSVISAATGATLGTKLEPRANNHFWYEDRCWRRDKDGNYRRVTRNACR
jgi:hypothetical protein